MSKKKTKSQIGKMSKNKGRAGELEAAKELSQLFNVECRRSQQYCGTGGDADVIGLMGIHVEVKRRETLNINDALQQAQSDSKSLRVPMVVHRKNGEAWKATVFLDDLPGLATQLFLILSANN